MPRWAEDVVASSTQAPSGDGQSISSFIPTPGGSALTLLGSRCGWHVVPVQTGQWASDARGSEPMLPCRGHRALLMGEGRVDRGP